MKNDQEKIIYPNIQLSAMLVEFKMGPVLLLFGLNGINSNLIQMLVHFEPMQCKLGHLYIRDILHT